MNINGMLGNMKRVIPDPRNYSQVVPFNSSLREVSDTEVLYHDSGIAMVHRKRNIPLDAAIDFLCDALKTPRRPSWCAKCCIGCLMAIRPFGPRLDVLRKSYQHFWRALAGFVTAPRTLEGLKALDKEWSVCHCNMKDQLVQDLHFLSTEAGVILIQESHGRKGPLGLFFQHSYEPFNALRIEKKIKPVPVAQGKEQELWPICLSDIMVHGPEAMVSSAISVVEFMDTFHAMTFLVYYLRICGPPLTAAALEAPLAKCIFDFGLRRYSAVTNAPRDPRGEVSYKVANPYMNAIHSIHQFMAKTINDLNWVPAQYENFYSGQDINAMRFYVGVMEMSESEILPRWNRAMCKYYGDLLAGNASLLRRIFPQRCFQFIHPMILQYDQKTEKLGKDSSRTVFDSLGLARRTQSCFALECPNSLQSANVSFKRCSGCNVVAYCGKDCQTKGWKDPRCAHKEICKKTRQVMDLAGDFLADEDEEKFVKRVKGKVDESILKDLQDWYVTLFSRRGNADGSHTPFMQRT